MLLVHHGGKCCGIKVIHSLGTDPTCVWPALNKIDVNNKDQYGYDVKSDDRFYHLDAPQETGIERLDRYIAFVKERRPRHLIEIVLADSCHDWVSGEKWKPILDERGFKVVTSFENSNSSNTCHVYHLVINEGTVEVEDDEDEDEDFDD